MNNLLISRYLIYTEIGKGSFSSVYKGINKKTNTEIVLKIEENITKHKKSCLHKEYEIYNILINNNASKYCPLIYEYIKTNNSRILILEDCGLSLEQILHNNSSLTKTYNNEQYNVFNIQYVLKLLHNMLYILKCIHGIGIIHRDIKPGNFIIKDNKLKIIDFGLSTRMTKHQKTRLISKKIFYNNEFIGTMRYCSINASNGYELSYRDDLESTIYILIYFINGYLPWQTSLRKNRIEKIDCSLDLLCSGIPVIFREILNDIKKLNFCEMPSYDKYINELNVRYLC